MSTNKETVSNPVEDALREADRLIQKLARWNGVDLSELEGYEAFESSRSLATRNGLYCRCCHEIHEFSTLEIERIVYALACMHADQCNRPEEEGDPEDRFECLKEVLDKFSYDIELYSEEVDGMFESKSSVLSAVPPQVGEVKG